METLEKEPDLAQLLRRRDTLLTFAGTLRDFYALGETKADYIKGIINIQMGASVAHELIFVELITSLNIHVKSTKQGKVFGSRMAVGLTAEYHTEPDIFYVAGTNAGAFANDRFDGVPDLVMEIISPSTRRLDLEEKRPLYQQCRVPEVYFVDFTKRLVMIDLLEGDEYVSLSLREGTFASRVLPGLVWEIEKMHDPGR